MTIAINNGAVSTSTHEVVEAEAENLRVNLERLGETAKLITEYEKLYDDLVSIITIPSPTVGDKHGAILVIVHLLVLCRRQFTMGCLTLLRAHLGDSLLHLRRAIESCAFAVRISKHQELANTWMVAVNGDREYEQFRKAFRVIFPKASDPDHDPILDQLRERSDRCSKKAHANIYGMGGYITHVSENPVKLSINLNFFDLPSGHSVISSMFFIFDSHKRILKLFGRIFEPYTGNQIEKWRNDFAYTDAKLDTHREHWRAVVPDPGRE